MIITLWLFVGFVVALEFAEDECSFPGYVLNILLITLLLWPYCLLRSKWESRK